VIPPPLVGAEDGVEALLVEVEQVDRVPGPGQTVQGRLPDRAVQALGQGMAVEVEHPHAPAMASISILAAGRTSAFTTTRVEAGGGSATQASRTRM
jgi:hypothetical protein